MTTQLYLENTYLFESDARILECKEDKDAPYVLLDRTIFYPQGGGQPSDHGKIVSDTFEYSIRNIKQIENKIRHYIDSPQDHTIPSNCAVKCSLDMDRRLINTRYHTAGHLFGNVVESVYPSLEATKCHAFPGEAYIEFHGTEIPNDQLLQEMLRDAISKNINTRTFEIDRDSFETTYYKLPYEISGNKTFRALQIGNYKPIPCGGTHVASTKEIGAITIKKIKQKNGILRVSFGVT